MGGGSKAGGKEKPPFSVRNRNFSSVTGVLSGAPFAFQSGISSSSARGSNTAPDRIWAPTSEPFSTTQTLKSRSEEHTSELQSLMRISYAVFCLKKKKKKKYNNKSQPKPEKKRQHHQPN